MATPLVEIALELANLYPEAPPDKISEAIITTVESESMLREIFEAVRLPSREEKRREELRLRAKRYKKKKAVQIKQKMEFISFLERLKSMSILPTERSSPIPFTLYNGGQVISEVPLLQPDNSDLMIEKTRVLRPTIELHLPKGVESDQYLKLIKEPVPTTFKEFIVSPSRILEEISERVKSEQILSFDDIQKISRVLEFTYDESSINEIFMVLENDVKLRNETFHTDCIEDLYSDEDSLPINMRTLRPRPDYVMDLIHERIRAVILNEYRRLHRLTGQEFIDGKIAYDEYARKTREYGIIASNIFPQ